jgi:hypothetical protein
MKTKRQLKKVADKNYDMGNQMYKTFKEKGGLEHLRASVSAFNVTLKAIKYQLIYKK